VKNFRFLAVSVTLFAYNQAKLAGMLCKAHTSGITSVFQEIE